MEAVTLLKTNDISHEEWLENRKRGIGGSDIGAIAGMNKWKSPIAVYLDKIGESEPQEENEFTYWGNVLEDVVAKEFQKRTGLKVQRLNQTLVHKDYNFMLANVDRVIRLEDGSRGILECKTASEYVKDQWTEDEVPTSYLLQVQWYLMITGCKVGYIAALIGGNKYIYKKIEADAEIHDYLKQIAIDFWKHVQTKNPPVMDGSESSDNVLKTLYPESEEGTEIDLSYMNEDFENMLEFEKQAKELQKTVDSIKQQIQAIMKTNEKAKIGERKITWKTSYSNRVDTKTLKTEMPEIYKKYCKESVSRRFTIK